MSEGLESIDHAVQTAHIWVNELDQRLGWRDKPQAYRVLRVVLHGLRDWLPVNEAADFAAQLPTLIRGVYYDQWRPAAVPVPERSLEDFIARIHRGLAGNPIRFTPEVVAKVFAFLDEKIAAGETEDVRQSLPRDMRKLWPARASA